MWGHLQTCGCPVCRSLPRVFSLINVGSSHSLAFLDFAGSRVRSLEADLRDELARLGVFFVTPTACEAATAKGGAATPPKAQPGVPPPVLPAPAFNPAASSRLPPPPPPLPVATGVAVSQPEPGLYAKKLPTEPPLSLGHKGSGLVPMKEEPKESPPTAEEVIHKNPKGEVDSRGKSHKRKRSRSKEKKRRKSRSRDRRRKKDKEEEGQKGICEADEPPQAEEKGDIESPKESQGERASSSKKGVEETPRRSREKERREKSREQSQLEGDRRGGKEKKRKEEGHVKGPRSPSRSPPGHHYRRGERAQSGREGHKGRGRGWIGPLPESTHWFRGKNKGIVKRAKQARHNEWRRHR